ncbi:ribonuclease P protein component [Patescibacteria group bacterium]|nr:ribonuclease P protein component [Patescibacteria group bacterium]
MLKKQHRLRKSRDFKHIGLKGRSVFGPLMTMRIIQSSEKSPKIGFITSTKSFKKAVDRNLIKRKMREIIRGLTLEIPERIHLVFILKPEAIKAKHQNLIIEARRLLSKIPEALTKPPKPSPRALKEKAKREAKMAK